MAATLQFVDSIASSPTLRLDINDGTIWLLEAEGTDFSPPALKTATADIILNDGATRSASSYENRRLKLRLSLKATSEDDKATKLRALQVELNRTCNTVKYQPGTTPLFFRVLRSPEYGLAETETYALTYVSLDIEAEPFAYGLQVTQTGVSVKANPALTNGCYLDVNGVTGDVETPAYIALSAGTVATPGNSYLSVRRHGTPASLTFAFQAESAALFSGTVVTGSTDATASGAGNNTTTTTYSSTAIAILMAVSPAAANQVEPRGVYRVLARVKKSVAGDTIYLSATSATAPAAVTAMTLLASTTSWQTVDLGLVQIPQNGDSPAGYGAYPPLLSTLSVSLYSARTAGTGTLKTDYLLLLPADEELSVFTSSNTWQTDVLVLDGPNDSMGMQRSGASYGGPTARAGSFPRLQPGNNRLFFVENISTAVISDASTLTVSFWPRYLTV